MNIYKYIYLFTRTIKQNPRRPHMNYTSVNSYLKNKYGTKVYKISLNAGLTCPNRDGTLSTEGCIFCSAGGSGEFAADMNKSIKDQIVEAKAKIASKNKNGKYIAYFQAYTNTYGDIDYLRKIYYEAISDNDIVAISIGTRPDCLGSEVLALLDEINKIKPVWIELGLQTIHEKTSAYINRGYKLSVFDEAVKNLNALSIDVIVHIILGLPNETKEDMLKTVEYVCSKNIQGIKLQLLHVLKGTKLAEEYANGKFDVMTMDEYIHLVGECLKIIPKDIVIHRLTGDGPKSLLIAPMWSADKKNVLNTMNKYLQNL